MEMQGLNILEFINSLVEQGYSEEEAERLANIEFNGGEGEDDYD